MGLDIGLANRRLQPLGHVSVKARMPETGRTGKRMYGTREGISAAFEAPNVESIGHLGSANSGGNTNTHNKLPTTDVPEHCEASARVA